MIATLVVGKLIQDPQHRVTSAGKSYCTALLSASTEDGSVLVSAIVFGKTAIEKLMVLNRDDTIAVTGTGKLSSWEKEGKQHHGLAITVDRVLTLYETKARQRAVAAAETIA